MKSSSKTKPLTVLYVEDEETDAFFMRRGFEQVAPDLKLTFLADGEQAVKYLRGQDAYCDRKLHPLPALVLLDLNLPALSGFEVLHWIRQQRDLKTLPVVIFSSSVISADKQKAEELGANGYLEKPSTVKQFAEMAQLLTRRWVSGRTGDRLRGARSVPAMRKLIRSKTSKAFLRPGGGWTVDCSRAQVFPTLGEAIKAAVEHRLKAVELYYLFGEEPSVYDFSISLLEQR